MPGSVLPITPPDPTPDSLREEAEIYRDGAKRFDPSSKAHRRLIAMADEAEARADELASSTTDPQLDA